MKKTEIRMSKRIVMTLMILLELTLLIYAGKEVRAAAVIDGDTSAYSKMNQIEGVAYTVTKCEDDTRYTFLYAEKNTSSEKVLKLRKHNEVIVTERTYQDDIMWGYATFCGCTGWVNLKFFRGIENGIREDWQPGTYFVSVKEMNLRESPSEDAESLAKLYYGEEYEILNIDKGWGEIAVGDLNGFVYMPCLTSYRSGVYVVNTITDYGIHYRNSPDSESDNEIGTIPNNTELFIEIFSNGWGYAQYNGQTGWVHLSDLYRKNVQAEEPAQTTDVYREESLDVQPIQEEPFPNLQPIARDALDNLPDNVSGGVWNTRNKIQGVEFNSDTMDRVYFSYAKYLAAYSLDGELLDFMEMQGYACDMDYYEGTLFITQRLDNYLFEVLIFDALDLSHCRTILLPDVNDLLEEDQLRSSSEKVKACIDGITAAPRFGTQDSMKLYVSYGVWDDASEQQACLRESQIILEYDLEGMLNSGTAEVYAERQLRVDLGIIKYGIQSLEYDRDSGDIWCAVRRMGQYSLFKLDKNSEGEQLNLIFNGSEKGWECEEAGDGICSLGNESFYILIPDYMEQATAGTAKLYHIDLPASN